MKRILVAVDGSVQALAAVETACGLARSQGARVVLACAAGPASGPIDRAEGGGILREAEELVRRAGVAASSELVSGDPVERIVSLADAVDAGLVVVGSRGRGAVASALLGSVSSGILHASSRPVLIVRGRIPP